MRRFAASLAILAWTLAQVNASHASASEHSLSSEAQLLGAIKLWGDVRFFDPQVAEGAIDWDAAFTSAEPGILAATTQTSYAAAIARLLAPLGDPATHVGSSPEANYARITVAQAGSASVITIEHGTSETEAAFQTDATNAVSVASKSRDIVFDLRGVTEANDADGNALNFFFSDLSSIAGLFSGDIPMPRARARAYLGYPDESGYGYQNYSAQDSTGDTDVITGKSKRPHRFGFLVNDSSSLPPLALAPLGDKEGIYTTRGQPAVLSSGTAVSSLPDGIMVTYRTANLADIAETQSFASATVGGVADAVARLQTQSPSRATYATPPPERFANKTYSDMPFPPEPMRMLAVARIYNVVRYFSPYTALMHDDWDAAALQAIRDERVATDARSYLLGLLRFYAYLHDSHGGFVQGPVIAREYGFGPPLGARFLHGQAVVTKILAAGSATQGLRIGDVVDTVDGVPIRVAMNRVEQYICSSTPQAADYAALQTSFAPSVFAGRRATTIALRFHHPGEHRSLVAVYVRQAFRAEPAQRRPKYSILAGNVGYVDFDRLEPEETDAMFSALRNTRAIIFDNRGYPQGAAWSITPRLTTATSLRLALFNTPYVIEPLGDQVEDIQPLPTYRQFYQMLVTATAEKYLKPTVMLIDERAISQSEHSALFFRATGHTRFVGTPTRGANGDVTSMAIPGGLMFRFSGEGVRWPDGKQLQRVGIVPDVRVEPTASDIATGNDVVLQRGLVEALRLSGASESERDAALRQEAARERAAFSATPSP